MHSLMIVIWVLLIVLQLAVKTQNMCGPESRYVHVHVWDHVAACCEAPPPLSIGYSACVIQCRWRLHGSARGKWGLEFLLGCSSSSGTGLYQAQSSQLSAWLQHLLRWRCWRQSPCSRSSGVAEVLSVQKSSHLPLIYCCTAPEAVFITSSKDVVFPPVYAAWLVC